MKRNFLILIVFAIIIIAINQTVQGQTNVNSTGVNQTFHEQTDMNFTKVIEDKYKKVCTNYSDPRVPAIERGIEIETEYAKVLYESPTTVLISGDLIIDDVTTCKSPPSTAFNSPLWNAMDMLKNQYGFKLQQVMTSGV